MVHVSELTADRASVALRHHAVYKAIWHDTESKIYASNRAGAKTLEYKISPLHIIMLGQPLVCSQRAARYVRDKLVRNGFAVELQDLGTVGVILRISWSTASTTMNMRALLQQQQQQSTTTKPCHMTALPELPPPPPQQQQQPLSHQLCLDQLAKRK